jgi:hypothetical protein
MISVWDLDKTKQRVPIDRYWSMFVHEIILTVTATGPVKDMMVNTGECVVRIKPNEGTSSLLVS